MEWIELLAQAGSLIDGFGISVAEKNLRAAMVVAKRRLERVVVGVGDGPVGRILAIVLGAWSDESPPTLSGTGAQISPSG